MGARIFAVIIVLLQVTLSVYGSGEFLKSPCVKLSGNEKEYVVSPLPSKTVNMAAIPTSYDWRNVNGKNLVTVSRNQHLPQ